MSGVRAGDAWTQDRVDTVVDCAVRMEWEAVAAAVAAGFPTSSQHSSGRGTILHSLAVFDVVGLLTHVLAAGADANARTRFGETPLHKAAAFGSLGALQVGQRLRRVGHRHPRCLRLPACACRSLTPVR